MYKNLNPQKSQSFLQNIFITLFIVSFLFSCGGGGSVGDDNTYGTAAPDNSPPAKVEFPITFETGSYTFTDFAGGSLSVIDNPKKEGNDSNKVAQMIKDGGDPWGGSVITMDNAIDFSKGTAFTVNVWSSRTVSVTFKLEHESDDTISAQRSQTHSGAGMWQTLTFDFTGATDTLSSIKKVIFIFDNNVIGDHSNKPNEWAFYIDDIAQTGGSEPQIVKLPVDFEGANYNFTDFEGGSLSVFPNQKTNGNDSANVARMTKSSGQVYGGSILELDEAINFTQGSAFTVKVWSARSVPVLFKLENAEDPANNVQAIVNHNGGSAWETLTFDFTGRTSNLNNIKKIIFIFDNETSGEFATNPDNWTFYIDDITQTTGTPPEPPAAGTAPTDAPAAPNALASDVISIFSETYGNSTGLNVNPYWNQATVATIESIASNEVWKLSNLNYQGMEFEGKNVSCMEYLHIDYWVASAFDIKVIAIGGSAENPYTINATPGSWQSVDIPITTYTDNNTYNIYQFKIEGTPTGNTVFIDNLYFSNAAEMGNTCPAAPPAAELPAPTVGAAEPTYSEVNVISLFSASYTDTAVSTWRTGWSNVDYTEENIDGNTVKKYAKEPSNAGPVAGIDMNGPGIDLSEYLYFSIDIWIANDIDVDSEFKIKLVDFGPDTIYAQGDDTEGELIFKQTTTPALTQGQWITLNMGLNDFVAKGLTNRASISQLALSGSAGISTFYVDNIIFHK